MTNLKPREVLLDALGDSVLTDTLHPQAMANQKVLPLEDEHQLRAWSKGAATVNALMKSADRRAINDQLWRYCASPAEYPLELRTVYGGSERPHSAEVLDWALPSLAIASAMQEYDISPKVVILSADQASAHLNGVKAEDARIEAQTTLELIEAVAKHYYPTVDLQTGRLDWDDLTAEPYMEDVELLRHSKLGKSVVKIVEDLEAMVLKRGGDASSVAAYLGLHNTAYAVYSGRPVIKIAGISETRFTAVQRGLAETHPHLVGSLDIEDNPSLIAGVIQNTSSTPPYYQHAGVSASEVLEGINDHSYPLPILVKKYGLGKVATQIAASIIN